LLADMDCLDCPVSRLTLVPPIQAWLMHAWHRALWILPPREGGALRMSSCHIRIACHGKAASPVVGPAVYAFIPEVSFSCLLILLRWQIRLTCKASSQILKKKWFLRRALPSFARFRSLLQDLLARPIRCILLDVRTSAAICFWSIQQCAIAAVAFRFHAEVGQIMRVGPTPPVHGRSLKGCYQGITLTEEIALGSLWTFRGWYLSQAKLACSAS